MTEERKEYLNKLYENLQKSQDDFEKQIVYISGGMFAASVFLVDKIVDLESAVFKCLLITSWIFLGLTLFVNFLSHFVAIKNDYKTICELQDNDYDKYNAINRNKYVDYMNIFSIATLLTGIIIFLIFTSINL